MRYKSMMLIVVALGCGTVASIGISQVMESKKANVPPPPAMEKIFVATVEVPLGETLVANMVKLEEWPRDRVPEGAVRKLEDLEQRRPLTRLYPGEPILAAKLVDANKFFGASEKIPVGMRVCSVKVTMDSSASGLINVGDRVDVLVFLKKGRGISLTGTRTILKNVTVFAVNERFQRDPDEDGESANRAKTVSLLVKPDQVEKVMLAQELGRIKLSLRRSDDDTEDQAAGATIADLDSDGSSNGSSTGFSIGAATGEGAGPGGITDFLQGLKAMSDSPADTSKQAWVMHIHTPTNVETFNWDDRKSLPRELLGQPELPAAPVAEPTMTDLGGSADFLQDDVPPVDSDSAAALFD